MIRISFKGFDCHDHFQRIQTSRKRRALYKNKGKYSTMNWILKPVLEIFFLSINSISLENHRKYLTFKSILDWVIFFPPSLISNCLSFHIYQIFTSLLVYRWSWVANQTELGQRKYIQQWKPDPQNKPGRNESYSFQISQTSSSTMIFKKKLSMNHSYMKLYIVVRS